jgi:hypothetical protein
MNIDIIFSWPKEYLNIVMGNGYGNPYTKEYFEYRDGENPHTSVRLNIWKIYVLAPRSPPKCAYPIKSLFSGSQLKISPPPLPAFQDSHKDTDIHIFQFTFRFQFCCGFARFPHCREEFCSTCILFTYSTFPHVCTWVMNHYFLE